MANRPHYDTRNTRWGGTQGQVHAGQRRCIHSSISGQWLNPGPLETPLIFLDLSFFTYKMRRLGTEWQDFWSCSALDTLALEGFWQQTPWVVLKQQLKKNKSTSKGWGKWSSLLSRYNWESHNMVVFPWIFKMQHFWVFKTALFCNGGPTWNEWNAPLSILSNSGH